MSIAKLYTWTPSTTILSAEVAAEIQQLIDEVNTMFKASGANPMLGDFTINKSSPAIFLLGTETSAKDIKLIESAGAFKIQYNNSGYIDLLAVSPTEFSVLISSNLFKMVPTKTSITGGSNVLEIGSDTTAVNTYLNILTDSSHSPTLRFGRVTKQSTYVKPIADTQFGFTTSLSGTKFIWVFDPPEHLTLSSITNITKTETPIANAIYPTLVPKAWAATTAAGSLSDGANLSVTNPSTGTFTYSFLTDLASANYAVVVTVYDSAGGIPISSHHCVQSKTTGGFTVKITSTASVNYAGIDVDHMVVVMGKQA